MKGCYPVVSCRDRSYRAARSSTGSPPCSRRCSAPIGCRFCEPGRSSTKPAGHCWPSSGCCTRTRKDGCCEPSSRAAATGGRRSSLKIHPNDDALEEFLLSIGDPHLSLVRHLASC